MDLGGTYLEDMLVPYTLLFLNISGRRAFSFYGHCVWNIISLFLQILTDIKNFKQDLNPFRTNRTCNSIPIIS